MASAPCEIEIEGDERLHVQVLGPLAVSWRGQVLPVVSRKGRALLALLALRGRPIPRTTVAELLWGPRGGKNLRQVLYTLRRLPGAALWLQDGERLGLASVVVYEGEGELLEDLEGRWFPAAFCDWLEVQRGQVAFEREEQQLDALVEPLARLLAAARVLPGVEPLAQALGVPEALVFRALPAALAHPGAAEDASSHHRLASALVDPLECAYHWDRAGRPDRAARALQRAGRLTEAAYAAVDPDLKLGLLGAALDEAERRGDQPAQEALLKVLGELSRVGGYPEAACESALRRSLKAFSVRDLRLARDLADEAYSIANDHGLERGGRVRLVLGQILLAQGANTAARDAFDAAVASVDEETSRLGLAGRGAAQALLGNLNEALADHEEALRRSRQVGDAVRVARGLSNVASDLTRLGRFDRAARRYQDAAEAARELGDVALEMMVLGNAPLAALWAGDFGRCRVLVREAYELAQREGQSRGQGRALDSRAELEWCCGRNEEAVRWYARAAALHDDGGDQLRSGLAMANAAVSAAEIDPTLVPRALAAIDDFERFQRPLLTWRLRLDIALFAPTDLKQDRWAARPEQVSDSLLELECLVRARWDVCAGVAVQDGVGLKRLAADPSHLQPLASALCAHQGLGSNPAQVVEARAVGLLGSQRDGVAARMDRWISTMTLE